MAVTTLLLCVAISMIVTVEARYAEIQPAPGQVNRVAVEIYSGGQVNRVTSNQPEACTEGVKLSLSDTASIVEYITEAGACAAKAIGEDCPAGAGSACEITCGGEGACSSGEDPTETWLVARSHTVVLTCAGEGACAALKVKIPMNAQFMLKCSGEGACEGIDLTEVHSLSHCCEEGAEACKEMHGTACADCKDMPTCRREAGSMVDGFHCEHTAHVDLGAGMATVGYAGEAPCTDKIIGWDCPKGAGSVCVITCDGEGACSGITELQAPSESVVLKCVGVGSCGGLAVRKKTMAGQTLPLSVLVLECLGEESCMPAEGKASLDIPDDLHFGHCCGEANADQCAGFSGHAFADCKEVFIPNTHAAPAPPMSSVVDATAVETIVEPPASSD